MLATAAASLGDGAKAEAILRQTGAQDVVRTHQGRVVEPGEIVNRRDVA